MQVRIETKMFALCFFVDNLTVHSLNNGSVESKLNALHGPKSVDPDGV